MSYTDENTVSCESSAESENGHDLLHDLLHRLKTKQYPFFTENSEQVNPKYTSPHLKRKADEARAAPIPATYETVINTMDPVLDEESILETLKVPNRSTKLYHALALEIFHTSDPLMTTHTKLIYLKQIERDYHIAKVSKDPVQIDKYIKLVNKTVTEYDEPWLDAEWVIASKAFFAPIHVRNYYKRVPFSPHVKRYAFSPALDDEPPIRIVLDLDDEQE